MKEPLLSILLCTYNGDWILPRCLDSILSQKYTNFEVLCIDGGSSDNTLSIISDYSRKDKRIKLIKNPNRLPEGKGNGKWLGFKKSKGDFIGIIDQDNILQRNDLFNLAIEKVKREDCAGVLGGLTHDSKDPAIVRYVSLFGTDSFFAYRSLDFLVRLKQKNSNSNYEESFLSADNMSLTGGNCFFYSKKTVERNNGYDQDVLVIKRLVESGINKVIIIKNSTKHYTVRSFFQLAKKSLFGKKSYYSSRNGFKYLPSTPLEYRKFYTNLFFNLAILPNLLFSFKIYSKSQDFVAFLYPLMAHVETISYGIGFIKNKIF